MYTITEHQRTITAEMNHKLSCNSFILFILAWTVIIGGLFFDVHETLEYSERQCISAEVNADNRSLPLHSNQYIKSGSTFIVSTPEVRDVRTISEVLKRMENNSSCKRIIILSLVLYILICEGAYYASVLPSIFPWTSIISSRCSTICYIHNQDGEK